MENRDLPHQNPSPQGPRPGRDPGTEWLLLVLGVATVVFMGVAIWVSYSGSRPGYGAGLPAPGAAAPGQLTPPPGADHPVSDAAAPDAPAPGEKHTPGPEGTPGSESMNP